MIVWGRYYISCKNTSSNCQCCRLGRKVSKSVSSSMNGRAVYSASVKLENYFWESQCKWLRCHFTNSEGAKTCKKAQGRLRLRRHVVDMKGSECTENKMPFKTTGVAVGQQWSQKILSYTLWKGVASNPDDTSQPVSVYTMALGRDLPCIPYFTHYISWFEQLAWSDLEDRA